MLRLPKKEIVFRLLPLSTFAAPATSTVEIGQVNKTPLALPGDPTRRVMPGLVVATGAPPFILVAGFDQWHSARAAVQKDCPARAILLATVIVSPEIAKDSTIPWPLWEIALSVMDASRRQAYLAKLLESNDTSVMAPRLAAAKGYPNPPPAARPQREQQTIWTFAPLGRACIRPDQQIAVATPNVAQIQQRLFR